MASTQVAPAAARARRLLAVEVAVGLDLVGEGVLLDLAHVPPGRTWAFFSMTSFSWSAISFPSAKENGPRGGCKPLHGPLVSLAPRPGGYQPPACRPLFASTSIVQVPELVARPFRRTYR
jgi:hypothetical protein